MSRTKKTRFNLTIPPSTVTRLKAAAQIEYKSVNSLINSYIKLGLMYSEKRIVIYSVNEDGSETRTTVVL